MIDFRYHIVSLIAVFLALSVGIVLGAGPLRDSIGDTLTGQVQDLREDRDQLRVALETAERDVTERTTYLEESAPVLLDNTLTDRRVTVVTLPGTVTQDVEELRDRLARAGAEVVGEVAVTEAWTDADTLSFRQTFAGQLLGYMDDAPAEDAGAEAIFGAALHAGVADTVFAEALDFAPDAVAVPLTDGGTPVGLLVIELAAVPVAEPAQSQPVPEPCLLYTSPSPRDKRQSRMPSSA